ncbi:MAG: isoprenylcysteine carboxylmethyltransferase family protein [Candidatus Thorarchaeota archaeon]|nr:MAG: isoprenylcysteine carboxylmethyltransferase family protein [Candidatus Thorarchaeota archaeon]
MDIGLIFRVGFILLWVLFIASRVIPSRGLPAMKSTRKERREAFGKEGLLVLLMLIASTYGNLIVGGLYLLDPPWMLWSYLNMPLELRLLGLTVSVLSLPYTYWIGKTLAKNYYYTVKIQKDQSLVTTGPYKRIRHPMYLVIMLFIASLVFVTDNWLLVVILMLMAPGLYKRIKIEEQAMIGEFGDEYIAYMKRTGRLFPKLRQSQ